MSLQAQLAVWKHAKVRGDALVLALYLADHEDEGRCWPSHIQSAAMTRMDWDEIKALLPELEKAGVLSSSEATMWEDGEVSHYMPWWEWEE